MRNTDYNNLDDTRNNLVQQINILSNEEFNRKPGPEMWSIAQVCQHLVLVEQATLRAIDWGLKQNKNTNLERKKVELILDRTKKIQAPKIVEPAFEPLDVEQTIDLLSNSRQKLMSFLSTLEDKSILTKKSVKHPALGELPLDQWIELIYLHEQRHIEQIKEIKLKYKGDR